MTDEATRNAADKIMEALDGKPDLRDELAGRLTPRLVICQDWEESERSWGTRPDGHTLHLTKDDCEAYIEGHAQVFRNDAVAPDEYTRPSGAPRLVKVREAVYQRLVEQQDKVMGEGDDDLSYDYQRHGIWGHHYRPGPPVYDGEDA